ncbi:enoyl-CoA hydratase [Aquisalibacillus elongatus]|uniref:Enoyl-CoA hydratase n=1 Tax=Aquisalibacillus elongatus TaxID=485577 RepID=A0A3N5CB49_9BACI|nr:enoyl-CoA hydratase [Aquisalibacillus elongatus]RPF57052.1 enoyl-CoA hydratase [Aquisalibacillus elongatus]
MEEKTVFVHREGPVTTIKLNREDHLNAMDVELLNELAEVLEEVQNDESNIVVLTGKGKAFSAGGDMKTMLQSSDPKAFEDVMQKIKRVSTLFFTMPKITISALNGAAAGLGLSIALAADYVIAKEDAKVAMNFIGIGLIPDGGGHFYMEQRVGSVKAKQLIWEGQMMTAKEAKPLGLVDVVCENLDSTLSGYLTKLSQAPLLAMIESKKIINNEQLPHLEEILDQETKGQAKMRQTEDHKEGVDAFLNKRKPEFKGE